MTLEVCVLGMWGLLRPPEAKSSSPLFAGLVSLAV